MATITCPSLLNLSNAVPLVLGVVYVQRVVAESAAIAYDAVHFVIVGIEDAQYGHTEGVILPHPTQIGAGIGGRYSDEKLYPIFADRLTISCKYSNNLEAEGEHAAE